MNWSEILSYVFGAGGLAMLVKTLLDWYFGKKRSSAEVNNIEANTGKAYGDQAKVFAEAVKISVEAKAMAEGIWRDYSIRLEQSIKFLEEKLKAERLERLNEQEECLKKTNDLQRQINELKNNK